MATWTARQAVRGIAVSRWGRPPPPPYFSTEYPNSETPPTTPTDPTFEYPDHPLDNGMPIPTSPMEEDEVHDWLESQLASTGEMSVVERLQYLLDTGQFADVNIRVGMGSNVTVFKAHRLLLSTASQPLYKMVYAVNPTPGPNDVTTIRVTDMKASDFKHILKYIYTDNVECQDINVAFEMLRASKKWGLAGLGIKSLTYLEEFLDDYRPTSEDMKTNLFDLLILSEQSLNDMYDKCWQVLVKYCNEIIPCEGFLNLDKPLIKKILNDEDVKFSDQLKLFEAIRDWGLRYVNLKELKMSQLGDVVEDLITAVDFEKIEDNDFVTTVLTSECLGKAEVIAFFMTHGLEIPRNLDFNNNKQLPFWILHCATSESEGKDKLGSGSLSKILPTLNEISPTISLKNGTVLAFHKVCRFRKGYRCPQKEIYQPHELRFRVSKNIKLLGVGFGFLFSCTDMGITIHCQGPWETRQWTDIMQTYCRVSGEKQEAADVRLMFSEPIRIEANQSYKILVKIGRMSSGSSDVELWGGTGAQYTVETEDADFFFIKAAVDPNKTVEEGEGDTKPGIITELLYTADTGDYDKEEVVTRRRRPKVEEEESEQSPSETSPWRKRHRPANISLQTDTTRVRRRETNTESTLHGTKKSPVEEYKPMSFSTNRWRTRNREEESGNKTPPVEEYKPTSFSTNRWRSARTRDEDSNKNTIVDDYVPSTFSSNRWRTKPQEDSSTNTNKANEEYKPSSYTSNRWKTKSREEDSDTKNTLDTSPYSSRKTSAEEKQESYSTSRWRTRSREEAPQTVKVELRKTIGVDDDKSSSSLPFLRRRESTENKPTEPAFMRRRESTETKAPEMPAYLRKRSNPAEENKTAAPFGRSRWGTSTVTAKSDEATTRDTTTQSRFLNNKDTSSTSSTYSSEPYSLRTRDSSATRFGSSRDPLSTRTTDTSYSRTRDSSLSRTPSISRTRDSSSVSRFGPSSTSRFGSSYLNRYDSSRAGGTDTGSNSISGRYGSSVSTESSQKRYTGAGSDSTLIRGRYGSSNSNAGTGLDTSGRYSSSASRVVNDFGSSSRYGSAASRGVNDMSSGNKHGSSISTRSNDVGSSSKYSSSASTGGMDAGSSSQFSRYSSPFNTRDTDSTSKGISSRYGSSSAMAPSSTQYDSRSSSRWSTDKGNDSTASNKYRSTGSRYGSSSNWS